MGMKFCCPQCRYIFRVRQASTKCPKCGYRPDDTEIKVAAALGLLAFVIVFALLAIYGPEKPEKRRRRGSTSEFSGPTLVTSFSCYRLGHRFNEPNL